VLRLVCARPTRPAMREGRSSPAAMVAMRLRWIARSPHGTVLAEDVVGLAVQRGRRRQDVVGEPSGEVVEGGWHGAHERAVPGEPADHGVESEGERGVVDVPVGAASDVVEGFDVELQVGAAAQRARSGEQPAHDRQRRTAQHDAGAAAVAGVVHGVLEDRFQLRAALQQVGELVDDEQWNGERARRGHAQRRLPVVRFADGGAVVQAGYVDPR
jgi:hypothetical protein